MLTLPQRKSPRLQGYDYSQAGAYFITICTHNRVHLFGTIADAEMVTTSAGNIATERWFALPQHHASIELDGFVVMPNHVHGILVFPDDGALNLSTVMQSYKSSVTRHIRKALLQPDLKIWQMRFHDHIIRNERDLNNIRHYVQTNPAGWEEDTFYS
ncbi:MAG: transposase [Chloroflexota bacterium]